MDNFRRNLLVNKKSGGEFVDLGLPSGLKWAKGNLKKSGNTCVIGEETDYGDFWSWANVGLTNSTGWMSSAGGAMTLEMYNNTAGKSQRANISGTDAVHDVACKYLGAPWRLPTEAEFEELTNNTYREWASINGIYGLKYKKKTDPSVYVFFPVSGCCDESGLSSHDDIGLYWSSTVLGPSPDGDEYFYICCLNTRSDHDFIDNLPNYVGLTIRPVQ